MVLSDTVGPKAPSTEVTPLPSTPLWETECPCRGAGEMKAFCSKLIIYYPCWLSMQPLPASSVLSAFVQRLRKHIKDGTSVLCLGEGGRTWFPKAEGNVLQISYTWVFSSPHAFHAFILMKLCRDKRWHSHSAFHVSVHKIAQTHSLQWLQLTFLLNFNEGPFINIQDLGYGK